MPYQMVSYTAIDKQYSQYDGRIALVLDWWPADDEPYNERYTIITPLMAEDYPNYINTRDYDCVGNTVYFQPYQTYKPVVVNTTGMPTFTERAYIKPPVARWDKRGERPVYRWVNGRWRIDGYEKRETL